MKTLGLFRCLILLLRCASIFPALPIVAAEPATVCIIPIREDIMPPLVYLVRRGVKEAMEAKADAIILDMDTNGGRVDCTEEILQILGKFPGLTATYVNTKAFSAGSFISVGTKKIYMAPESVIGAATPIIVAPGGGVEKMSESFEAKMTSGVKALVRGVAQKNGHNVDVVEAMVDRNKELKIDGHVLNEKGQILTLTSLEAEKTYGDPAKPLLSLGTKKSIDEVISALGFVNPKKIEIKQTGGEKVANWINTISPVLMMIGIAAIYLEMKTPGFGIPGITAIIAFTLYFLGGYIAGISDSVWIIVFIVGLILIAVELFIMTGTIVFGMAGLAIAIIALIMAMVDFYPGHSFWPTAEQLHVPLLRFSGAVAGSFVLAWAASRLLPRTAYYSKLVSQGVSGEQTVILIEEKRATQLGLEGVAISALRPGGKGRFGNQVIDVMAEGGFIDAGAKLKIIGHTTASAIVQQMES